MHIRRGIGGTCPAKAAARSPALQPLLQGLLGPCPITATAPAQPPPANGPAATSPATAPTSTSPATAASVTAPPATAPPATAPPATAPAPAALYVAISSSSTSATASFPDPVQATAASGAFLTEAQQSHDDSSHAVAAAHASPQYAGVPILRPCVQLCPVLPVPHTADAPPASMATAAASLATATPIPTTAAIRKTHPQLTATQPAATFGAAMDQASVFSTIAVVPDACDRASPRASPRAAKFDAAVMHCADTALLINCCEAASDPANIVSAPADAVIAPVHAARAPARPASAHVGVASAPAGAANAPAGAPVTLPIMSPYQHPLPHDTATTLSFDAGSTATTHISGQGRLTSGILAAPLPNLASAPLRSQTQTDSCATCRTASVTHEAQTDSPALRDACRSAAPANPLLDQKRTDSYALNVTPRPACSTKLFTQTLARGGPVLASAAQTDIGTSFRQLASNGSAVEGVTRGCYQAVKKTDGQAGTAKAADGQAGCQEGTDRRDVFRQ